MKPIDKKEMPKLIALIAVAVIAFGYGIFTFMSGSTAKPPPPAPSPAALKVGAGGKPGEPAEDGTWRPEIQVVALPTGGRDPFMPDGESAPKATPSPAPPATPAPDSTPLPQMRPGEPPLGPRWPANGGPLVIPQMRVKGVSIKPTPAPTPVPAPVPLLNVSGVLVSEEAERSVAIVKDGEKGNRFLSIGDAAGNGWRVTGIKQREIEITDPKTGRRKTVEMKP